MTAHHRLVILASFVICILLPALPADAESLPGFRGTMIRRTGTTAINFTQAARDSYRRLSSLASRSSTSHLNSSDNNTQRIPLRMDDSGGAYDMEFSMGTPPQKLTALADTGSDLIWAKCGGACTTSCEPQGSPSYLPNASSTFAKLPCSDRLCSLLRSDSVAWCAAAGAECDYRYSYGLGDDDHHYTQGFLARETFTLGADAVPSVRFGCTTASEGGYGSGSGLVGLGRGPLSLVSQLNASTFMYCLTSDASKASPLLFGSLASLTGAQVQSTGLLASTTFYAVNLRSISIGSATTPGVGEPEGVVFDSGTTLTYLAEPAYSEAKAAFLSQTSLDQVEDTDGFEACFQKPANGRLSNAAVPTMVLHFDGADMALPVANYVVEVEDGVVCWIVQRSPSLSIIGNIMQVNYLVLHDVHRSVLSFQPANCDTYQANEASRPL
uniref:Peptidase A1 domain-containing protein n=1 Tax=Zea mays TaxID=4577 RepID=A0A804PY49_MAIZE|eukprot:XP_008650562.1 aspartic proteinase nepenthesin-1 [Zea mays]